jgi:hypothetical protein
MTVESCGSGARRDAVSRQRVNKHIPKEMNTHATIELLGSMISMQSVPSCESELGTCSWLAVSTEVKESPSLEAAAWQRVMKT